MPRNRIMIGSLIVAVLLCCTVAGVIVSVPEHAPVLEWSKTYGRLSESSHSLFIEATTDGGYIAGGSTDRNREFYVVKTDMAGNTQWNRTWTVYPLENRASCAIWTSDGGYALAGLAVDLVYVGSDIVYIESAVLIKTDSHGVQQWNRTYGANNYAEHVEQTADGGYVLAGGWDTWLAKTDANGILQWNRTYTSGHLCFAHQLEDGGYVAAGFNGSSPWEQSSFFLLKTNPDGGIEWSHAYKDGVVNVAFSSLETSDGGYIIAGTTQTTPEDFFRILVVKTDSHGNELWRQTYGGNDDYCCSCIRQTSEGGYALAGQIGWRNWIPWMSQGDPLIIKIDSAGSLQWTKRNWDEIGGIRVHSFVQSSDGGYVIAGRMQPYFAYFECLFIAKLTSTVTVKPGPALLFGLLVVSSVLESALLIGLIAAEASNMRHQREGR